MIKRYIMTVFGEDKPGLVADVTELLYEYDYNLEDSRMTRLLDEFAIILSFSGSDEKEKALEKSCRRLELEKGIFVYFRPIKKSIKDKNIIKKYNIKKIVIEGFDQTGIVYKITKKLAELGINIDNLNSKLKPSPESGSNMYKMEILVQIPPDISIETINQALEPICDEMHLDIIVE